MKSLGWPQEQRCQIKGWNLLKLLTGQCSITAGSLATHGCIVALTDLGMGFDPVLTYHEMPASMLLCMKFRDGPSML